MKKRTLIGTLLLVAVITMNAQQKDFPKLNGPYLGQKPPGMTPEIFAPGIISTPAHEYSISFSIDLKEIYLQRIIDNKGKKLVFCYESDKWIEPKEVRFHDNRRYGEIHLTPDGKYLLANLLTDEADGKALCEIEKFSKYNGVWGNPIKIGPGMSATSSEKGNIYMTDVSQVGSKRLGAIAVYKFKNDNYEKIEILGPEINIPSISSSHPYIAPDESYLIFDSKREGDKNGCLYISFRIDGKNWSKPINLSKKLNTGIDAHEWIATVSPDGKYLFYNVGGDIYWVSAKIIDDLRSKE